PKGVSAFVNEGFIEPMQEDLDTLRDDKVDLADGIAIGGLALGVLSLGGSKRIKGLLDAARKGKKGTGNVAPSAHPGKIAAESSEVSYESIIRALRQNGSRDAYATLALLKRGKVDFTIKEKGPPDVGGQYFFNSRKVEIYTKYATTPERAAGITAHEVKHWMQKLNVRNYTKQSEFEAFVAQRNVDKTWFLRTEGEIWNFINSHPAYKKLK
ncbi:hypothetical protein ACSNN6_29990, partial [Brevibacillus formosus]